MHQENTIDLTQPPTERWNLTDQQIEHAQLLLDSYLRDLGGLGDFADLLSGYAQAFVAPDYRAEIQSIADRIGATIDEALLVNLYYDATKFVFGCTAFAVDTPDGPLHARNLDWWTENDMLSRYTLPTRFTGASHGDFITVGWPGFIGALSGIAPGRFAITLNAVLSDDPPALARPISLFLRTVFEQAATYDDAIKMLSEQQIASDCLLLITGTQPGQMAVIERAPTRSAIRYADSGFIVVANDYQALDANEGASVGELQATSCNRFQQATKRLRKGLPTTAEECLSILSDSRILANITVQQMVFSPSKGIYELQLPERG